MAYLLDYDDVTVIPYLFALDLSREGRIILAAALSQELHILADAYSHDPGHGFLLGRTALESICFSGIRFIALFTICTSSSTIARQYQCTSFMWKIFLARKTMDRDDGFTTSA